MIRSTFFAFGLFMSVWGVSLLMIDKIVLDIEEDSKPVSGFRGMFGSQESQNVTLQPPTWLPFNLMSVGSVTMLYSVMLKRNKG